jgi:NodT family efflux transporter outer membrane factor (OMF) lipoprotein
MNRIVITALLSLAIAGCKTVGPTYERPTPAVSGKYQAIKKEEPAKPKPVPQASSKPIKPVGYVRDAVANNHDIKVAQARIREARASRRIASARAKPNVNVGALHQNFRQSDRGPIGSRGLTDIEDNLFDLSFDASWEVDVFGGIRRATSAAGARLEAADDVRRDTLISVVTEVVRNYTELRGAQRRLELAEKNIRIQADTFKLAENKFKTGLAPELDVQRARTQLKTTQSRVPSLRAAIHAAALRIAVLTGRQPAALLDDLSKQRAIPAPPEIVPVGLPSDLLRRRPDVRRVERELNAATDDIGAARADLYPRFSLTGAAGLQSVSFTEVFSASSRAWSIGPTIRWPVFQGGRIRANISSAEARRDATYEQFKKTVLIALEDVERSLVNYAEEQLERRELEMAVESSTRAVKLASVLYEKGLSDFLTVLDAERTLRDVEDKLAASETAVSVNLIRLYKALGGGWEVFEETYAKK